jgi:hypothetical protein
VENVNCFEICGIICVKNKARWGDVGVIASERAWFAEILNCEWEHFTVWRGLTTSVSI